MRTLLIAIVIIFGFLVGGAHAEEKIYKLSDLLKEIKHFEGEEVRVIAYFRDAYPKQKKFMVRENEKYIFEVHYGKNLEKNPIIRFLEELPPYSKVKLFLKGVIKGKAEPPFRIYWMELKEVKVLDLGGES